MPNRSANEEPKVAKQIASEIVGRSAEKGERPGPWLLRKDHRSLLHPLTGLCVLGFDWLLFSSNLLTGMLATHIVVLLGFVLGALSSYIVQRNFSTESRWASVFKALLCGIVVGLPFPIAGSALGGIVLLLAGLRSPGK